MAKKNLQLIALYLTILGICLTVIGILAGITKPEIREFFGLEKTPEPQGPPIADKKRKIFDSNILFEYIYELDNCEVQQACDCCGGDLAFTSTGIVIYSEPCAGSPSNYYVGTYNITQEGIFCVFKNHMISTDYENTPKTLPSKVKAIAVEKNKCPDETLLYRLRYDDKGDALAYKNSRTTFIKFMERLYEYEIYSSLMKI